MEEEFIRISKYIETPSYLFDLESLRHHIIHIKEELGEEYRICFAMKANPFLISFISQYTDRLEVCSPGEYEICIREEINPEKIIVSGVNKTEDSIMEILKYSKGKGIYTVESLYQYEVLKKCFSKSDCLKENNIQPKVILRLSSGNQFGMDKYTIEKILTMNSQDNEMNITGLHFYSGTQKKMKVIEKEAKELNEYASYLKQTYGISDLELEYGPGLAVNYFSGEEQNEKEVIKEFTHILHNMNEYKNVCIELGRYLTSECGYYFTEVKDVKRTEETNYIIVDGGIHQINYYGQIMGMKKPFITVLRHNQSDEMEVEKESLSHMENMKTENWQICGSLCTANDIIVRGVMMQEPKRGDVLVFKKVGAYSATEGMSMFLSRELPDIYIYTEEGNIVCIRKKIETNLFTCRQ